MDVFDLRNHIVGDYAAFTRSFTRIKAPDIREQVDSIYGSDRYWPEPLLQLSPHFAIGPSMEELATRGEVHATTAAIFGLPHSDGTFESLRLHAHQAQALAAASHGESFVVTTGTGSGKSLCFFIPIVDAVVRARSAGSVGKTTAIIVYPMNALANSQIEEVAKFLQNVAPTPVSVARYTGQESDDERRRIASNPPDVLLTNFMMLEYLMTRQDELDRTVIGNCSGLRFLVLDELHTYRGRQGADVALLVRRLRARLAGDQFQCIGTSATMSSGSSESRNVAVAEVSSRVFGVQIKPTQVIGETLRRVTDNAVSHESLKTELKTCVEAGIAPSITDSELVAHPLAIWVETRLGLEREGGKWVRAKPRKLSEGAALLAEDSGASPDQCLLALKSLLMLASLSEQDRPGGAFKTGRGFFAFRLHQFIAGAGAAYSTLEPPPTRRITTNGQQFFPEAPSKRLYSAHFCRECGQEYHPVTLQQQDGTKTFLPRDIDDVPPKSDEEASHSFGFVLIQPNDPSFDFDDRPTDYPEDWLEVDPTGDPRLKPSHRHHRAQRIQVDATGRLDTGHPGWFIPGKFRFCVTCKNVYSAQGKDNNRLASLSAEGRSSATTLFTHSTLRWMGKQTTETIPVSRRKLLGFTDNRQDAALQAGHFNDFLFVSLLRAGVLGATSAAGSDGLTSDRLGAAITKALGFDRPDRETRSEWLADPELDGAALLQAQRTLRELLAYRAWFDQRKGWRFSNPNLEQLGMLEVDYMGLQELAERDEAFAGAPDLLASATPQARLAAYRKLFDVLRQGLAIDAEILAAAELEALKGRAAGTVRQPWGFSRDEKPRGCRYLLLSPPTRRDNSLADEDLLVRGGYQSQLGRTLKSPASWDGDARAREINRETYGELLNAMLVAARRWGLVVEVPTPFGATLGWQLKASSVVFLRGAGVARSGAMDNAYFRDLYANLSEALVKHSHGLFRLEAREHTAQVESERRAIRELRFRYGSKEQAELEANAARLRELGEAKRFLPVMYCSPTMELGVDISALNMVYLRNVPPTPANYAQRSGRAGRSGMPALVLTYTAARSPHDQFFLADPPAMVHGEVRTPTLDLANEDLVRSHLQAVWMACTNTRLDSSIARVVEPDEAKGLPLRQEVKTQLSDAAIAPRAKAAMLAVLDLLQDELTPEYAPWFTTPEALSDEVTTAALDRFDKTFSRWRELFLSAARQRDLSRRIMDNHALPERERNAARVLHGQAIDQLNLLQRGTESSSSDYYSYRYLATEGFLPGYNFPRLPLTAFIPATLDSRTAGSYLQRPRFLALSEFGPRSLVYHEGRAYRVTAAMLGVRDKGAGNDTALLTDVVTVCRNCGAGHFRSDPHDQDVSHCRACSSALTDNSDIVRNLYRIENVSTWPAERITVNDEERKRQGFELQTTFRWARRESGALDVRSVVANDSVGVVARLQYGPGAEISRINKGLRRRADPRQHGFMINPINGQWAKLEDDDHTGEGDPTKIRAQLVVPWVKDLKNALLFHLGSAEIDDSTIATVQYALKRGVETVFQLEESELLAEPLPDRKGRKGVLFYEATEGGAGVLTRLVHDPRAIARVAHAALRAMHYDIPNFGLPLPSASSLADVLGADCVAGCYRCLLSYFNQPDHLILDRKDKAAIGILLRLASSTTTVAQMAAVSAPFVTASSPPSVSDEFDATSLGLPEPDATSIDMSGSRALAVWRSRRVAVLTNGADPAPWLDKGVQAVCWPSDEGARAQTVSMLKQALI